MEEIEGILQEYVSTANNPKYKGDYSVINSKFPELKNYDKDVLQEYVSTANNKKYNGDYKVINSKFPEFFEVKKKGVSQPVGPKTAKASTTSVNRKSLLDTVGQKKDAASVSSSGKTKIPAGELSRLKGEFDESVRNKPKTIKQKIQGEEMGLLAKPKSSIGVTKVQDQNRFKATKKKEETQDFNFFGIDSLKRMDETGKIKYANDDVEYDVDKSKFDFFLQENLGNAKMKKRNDYINNFELQEIEDEYNELKQGGGFFDKAKKAVEFGFSNVLAMGTPYSIDPISAIKANDMFWDDRQEVMNEAKKKGESLSQAQIDARVEKTFKDRRINEILSSKRQDTGRNLTDAEQYALSKDVISNSSKLSDKHKDKSENLNSVYITTKGLLDEKKSIEATYNSDPKLITKEQADRYKDISEKIQLNAAYIEATTVELNDAEKKIKTAQEEVADYTIENSRVNEFFKRIEASLVSFIGSTTEFVGKYGGKELSMMPGGKGLGEGVQMLSEKVSDNLSNYASEMRTGKEEEGFKVGGLPETKEINNVGNFVNKITEIFGDNTFLVTGLAVAGVGGVVGMAVEMAGDKSREIRNESQEFNKISNEAKEKGDKSFDYNGEKYNVGDKLYGDFSSYALPLAWGATSVLPMVKQLKYLKGAKSAIQAIEKESPDLIKRSLMTKVKDGTKDYIGHSLSLAKDLKLMSLAQDGLNDLIGKEVDYFKTASDMSSIRDSFVLHGMNKVAAVAISKAAKPYMTSEEVNTIDGNANLIFDLTNRLRDPSLESSDKAIIKSQLDRLVKESDNFIGGVLDRMSEMSDRDYSEVISLAKESSNLRQEASDIQASSFTKTEKAYALEKVKKEYIENEKKLRDLRVNYTKRTDGFYGLSDQEKTKLKERAATELKEKRGNEENFTINDREITIKATEIYDRENNVEENNQEQDTQEENVYYYNTNPERGELELKPLTPPKGYTTVKEVQNAFELDAWRKQKGIEVSEKTAEENQEVEIENELTSEEIKEVVSDESFEISEDELSSLEKEIESNEKLGTLSDNVGKRMFMNGEPGMVEIEGQQLVFKTSTNTFEFGNKEQVGDNNAKDSGLSDFSNNGINVEAKESGFKISTESGGEFEFVSQRRDKKGQPVVKVKDSKTKLIRTITGEAASEVLKEISLAKPKKPLEIKLTTEGKETSSEADSKDKLKEENEKKKQDFENKTIEEIEKMKEEADKSVSDFEQSLLDDISKESKKDKKLIVSVKGNRFAVTKTAEGKYSVSQERNDGKFVNVKEESKRNEAIDKYKEIIDSKDSERIRLAEELASEYKKEQEDKVIKFLDDAINKLGGKNNLFDATIGVPVYVLKKSLEAIKLAYKAGKTLAEAIAEGYKFIDSQGHKIKDVDYKKYVLKELTGKESKSETNDSKSTDNTKKEEPTIKERKPKQTVEDLKEEVKDLKGQVIDVFKAAVDAVKITEKSFAEKIKAVKASVQSAKTLFNEQLKKKKLTSSQYKALTNKMADIAKSSTPESLEKNLNIFINSLGRYIENSDKKVRISELINKRKKAISNVSKTLLGTAKRNIDTFKKLLSINPKNVSERYIEEYENLLSILSGDSASLKATGGILEIDRRANDVIREYEADKELLSNSYEKYLEYLEENELDHTTEGFPEVLSDMKSMKLINQAEFDILTENKSKFTERKPVEKKQKKEYTPEEKSTIKQSVKDNIKEYRENNSDQERPFVDSEEKKVIDSVFNGLDRVGDEFLDSLSDKELDSVHDTIALLNEGIVQGGLSYTVDNSIKSFEKIKPIKEALNQVNFKWRSLSINPKIKKTLFDIGDFLSGKYDPNKNKSKLEQADRKLQSAVDQVFGIVGDVLNKTLLAEQASNKGRDDNYRATMKNKFVNPISQYLEKSFKGDKVEQVKSLIRTNIFAYQRLFESGKGGERHRNIEDIINSINSKENDLYSKSEKEFINSELEIFRGLDFNSEKYYETLSEVDKEITRKTDEFYVSDIQKKASASSKFRSGRTLPLYENYRPVTLVFDGEKQISLEDMLNSKDVEPFFNPSFKAGNLEMKKGSLGEGTNMIINIKDPLFSMEKYIDDVSLRYHNLDSIKVAEKTLNDLMNDPDISSNETKKRVVKYLKELLKKDTENLVSNSLGAQIFSSNQDSAIGKFANKVLSNVSSNKLLGISKVASETVSNLFRTSATLAPFVKGISISSELHKRGLDMDKIQYVLGFSQGGRIFGPILDFKNKKEKGNIDFSQEGGVKTPKRMPSVIENKIYKLLYKSGVEDAKLLSEQIAKSMMETPDKMIAKPLSIGVFDKVFKELTGESPNYEKIEAEEIDYLDKNEQNIKEAIFKTNKTVAMIIGSKNPFEMVSNNMVRMNDPIYKKLYTQANSFFTNHQKSQGTAAYVEIQKLFRTNEYKTKEQKLQAAKTLASIVGAQYTYKASMRALKGLIGASVAGALGYTSFKDEEDEEGTLAREASSSVLDIISSSSGNISKIPFNMAVGYLDTKYGREVGLRNDLRNTNTSVGFGYNPKQSMSENIKNSLYSASGSYGVAKKDTEALVDNVIEGNVGSALIGGASILAPIPGMKDISSAISYLKYNSIPSVENQKEIYNSGSSKEIKELESKIYRYTNTLVYNKFIKAYKEGRQLNSSERSEIRKDLSNKIHYLTKKEFDGYIESAVKNARIRIRLRKGEVSSEVESYLQMKDSDIKDNLVIKYRDSSPEERKEVNKLMIELRDLGKINNSIVNDIRRVIIKGK